MSETDQWLDRFRQQHARVRLRVAYWPGIAALLLGVVGLLWALPVPAELQAISPLVNWGSVFLMAAVIYYFIISVPLAIGMLPVVLGITAAETWLALQDGWLRPGAALLTMAGVAGLYLGHRANGGLRAVFRDIQLLMIAPLWLLSTLYRRLGIPH
ncbi:MAG: hypothetical protein U5K76_08775 [Woeseiaceae bacterium]|nr:hypothetical protein [Woeseiaceae bacterium]